MLALQCKEGRAACANLFINPLIDGVPASWSKYCALEIFTNMGPWQKTWRLSSEMKGSVVLCFGGYWSCCYSHHIHKWIIICIRLSILFSFLKQLLREIQYQIFNPATFIVGNRSFYTQIWGICSCKSYISPYFISSAVVDQNVSYSVLQFLIELRGWLLLVCFLQKWYLHSK